MAYSKIVFGGETLIDLTGDTITADKLAKGTTAHGKDGEAIVGSSTKDVDSSKATAAQAEILRGKTAAVRGSILTGTMPNVGAIKGEIAAKTSQYTVPQGYHDGSGKVAISAAEQAKIIPGNIKAGITILGVKGSMTGAESVTAQEKTVTPAKGQQIITPDPGTDYLSQVTVKGIPYAESPNSAGGMTATIG